MVHELRVRIVLSISYKLLPIFISSTDLRASMGFLTVRSITGENFGEDEISPGFLR
jgi:hypothetical protein